MKGLLLSIFVSALVLAARSDVSHLVAGTTSTSSTPPPPPRPYAFSYSAGRYPGHADRAHAEVSDGSGVVRGKYSYVDPLNKIRTVEYVADSEGFHASAEPPAESEAVAHERERHLHLYAAIADDHANNPHPQEGAAAVPRQSAAVAAAAERHHELFARIAQQHAQLAYERDQLMRRYYPEEYNTSTLDTSGMVQT